MNTQTLIGLPALAGLAYSQEEPDTIPEVVEYVATPRFSWRRPLVVALLIMAVLAAVLLGFPWQHAESVALQPLPPQSSQEFRPLLAAVPDAAHRIGPDQLFAVLIGRGGVSVVDPASPALIGHDVCGRLPGVSQAQQEAELASATDDVGTVFGPDSAHTIVSAAIAAYCPQYQRN